MNSTLPLALTFLTKLPWPWRGPADNAALARSMFWFPWVGALLGLGFWIAWLGLYRVLPAPAAAALLLVLTVWATGGLHSDGLADTADGLAGSREPAESLRLMKDSRVGTFGVLGLILVLLLKFALFLSLAAPGGGARALLIFPVLSRWGMVLLAFLSPYARPEGGLGQAMTLGVSPRTLAGASLSAAVLAFLFLGGRGLALLAAAGALTWLGSLYFQKRLGGITGDVLGAANEVLEVLVLAGALLFS
ncbi:MAG TPA: adenosylcobinamide-GDP ribazoletransferase [Desulfobaccales bacterium]|nr:adenosylcobinamide-GDP ribazoletransferase [Desulfobaccales bacterium]